jgi:hypothetical protein
MPPEVSALALAGPAAFYSEQAVQDHRANFAGGLSKTGLYHAKVQQGSWQAAPRLDVIVNASLQESDFAPVRVEDLQRVPDDASSRPQINWTSEQGQSTAPLRQLGSCALLLLAILWLGEALLAART